MKLKCELRYILCCEDYFLSTKYLVFSLRPLIGRNPTEPASHWLKLRLGAHKTFACSEQTAENRVQTARLRLIREHSLSRTLSTSVLLKKNKISFWEKYRAQ